MLSIIRPSCCLAILIRTLHSKGRIKQMKKNIYRRRNDFNDLHKQDDVDTKYENERKNVKGKNIE